MLVKTIASIVLVLVAVPAFAQGQIDSKADMLAQADSVVAAGELEALRQWVAAAGDQAPPALTQFLARVDAVIAGGEAVGRRYVRERLPLPTSLTEVQAGARAVVLYRRFEEQAAAGDYPAAVMAFEAAQYLRRRHADHVRTWLQTAYDQASYANDAGDVELADVALDRVAPYLASTHPAHRDIIARIQTLRNRVDLGLEESGRNTRFFAEEERRSASVGVSVSASVVTREGTGPLTLAVSEGVETEVALSGFDGTTVLGLGAEAYLFLSRRVAFGAGVALDNVSYSNPEAPEPHAVSFSVASRAAYVLGRFRFRTRVGLQPYVLAGLGWTEMDRDESAGATFIDNGVQIRTRPFTLSGDHQTGAQMRTALGLEYVSCAACALTVGAEAGAVYNAVDSPFVSEWQVAAGLRALVSL